MYSLRSECTPHRSSLKINELGKIDLEIAVSSEGHGVVFSLEKSKGNGFKLDYSILNAVD